ncbi:DUF4234 domain-containing protein [Rubritalea marina]|uniref:DUF4234 domain-containing protein n=1 Tax=Rubritalea marina TaxID=361055 RepID=UPI0003A2B913|nr:DUF4234 domain-containing protein [Rubritalea marina]
MHDNDLYAAPMTDVTLASEVSESHDVITDLKSQSTWRLLFLSTITLGIYGAHYMVKQTEVLNTHLEAQERLSETFTKTILAFSYLSTVALIPYSLMDVSSEIDQLYNTLNNLFSLLFVIWAFKARNRMNKLIGAHKFKGNTRWFHGFWTFLFQYFYFNYKVNQLAARNAAEPAQPPLDTEPTTSPPLA